MTTNEPLNSSHIHSYFHKLEDTGFYPADITETLDRLLAPNTFDELAELFDFVTQTRIRFVFRDIRHYDAFYKERMNSLANLTNRIVDIDFI